MAENEVKIIVTTDASGAVTGIQSAAGTTGELGDIADKTAKKGSESFQAMGMASARLGEALGVPYRASHVLGTQVEYMAARVFPGWALALNISAVAVTAVVMGVMALATRQKEAAEATQKHVDALKAEMDSFYANVPQTEKMRVAIYNVGLAKRDLLKVELVRNIWNETNAIADQEKELKKLNATFNEKESYNHNELVAMGLNQEAAQRLTAELNLNRKEIIANKELLKSLNATPTMQETWGPSEEQYDAQVEEYRVFLQNKQYAADQDFEFNKRINEAIIAGENAKLDAARVRVPAEIALEKQKNASMQALQLTYYQSYTNIASQALDAYVAITGKRNAAAFVISKALAIAQIAIDTERAAIAAAASVAGIPVVGEELAVAAYARMKAMGYISMGIVAATTLGQLATGTWNGGGGGGGGGGSIGTYPASPGTGQPSTETQQQQINIYINNPLSTDNWELITEKYIVPALNANGDRGVQINSAVVAP